MSDLVGLLVGFLLTLLVFSYLWGDNPAYRLAVHLLVGVSAAYAAVVTVEQFLWPVYLALRQPEGQDLLWLIPLLLALLLLLKLTPRLAPAGRSAVAFLVGAGAAVAVVGAVAGTLIPMVVQPGSGWRGFVVALLTITLLVYFRLTRQSSLTGPGWLALPRWEKTARFLGRSVLTITLGAVFAGVLSTSLVLLVDRVSFFVTEIGRQLGGLP